MHRINVSIVYALRDKQWQKSMIVERGTSAIELLRLSQLQDEITELKMQKDEQIVLGVFSQKVSHDYLLEEGDRVEIYRPLTADPKEVRRQLALLGKTIGNST